MKKLAMTGIDKRHPHVAHCGDRSIAWYRMDPVRWNWRPDAEREALITATAQRLAALVDCRVYWRVTHRPESPEAWANATRAQTRNALPGLNDYFERGVRRLEFLDQSSKEAYVGVELSRPASRWLSFLGKGAIESKQIKERVAEVDRIVADSGFRAKPITAENMEWLLHSSVALGCPPPGGGDVDEATDRAEWTVDPFGKSVRVEAVINGESVVRYVATATVGRMGDLSGMVNDPWIAKLDQLDFPVEVMVTIDVLPSGPVLASIRKALLKVRSQLAHFAEHDMDPPLELEATRARALEIQQEIDAGFSDLSTRANVWVRFSAPALTETDALDHIRKVQALFSPNIKIVGPNDHLIDQYDITREQIIGEPLANTAYQRTMPVRTLAAAQPAVTAVIGHRQGMYCGYTTGAGGEHSVFWDLHAAPEGRRPGGSRSALTLISGGLGAGKSGLLGQIVYYATLAGVRCVVLDPSGPLARLCSVPELAPYARHIDLLDAQPGILNPWRIIPDPIRSKYANHIAYEDACKKASAQRRSLCVDSLAMMLPASLADHGDTRPVLRAGARAVDGLEGASPSAMIYALRDNQGDDPEMLRHARKVASYLEDISDLPEARLMFPTGDPTLDYSGALDWRLEVYTLMGAQIPDDDLRREDWTTEEQMAMPLLHAAGWKTYQTMYKGDPNERKLLAFDEGHAFTRVGSGRNLFKETARNSRKRNTRSIFSSQNVADALRAGVHNFVDNSFLGRTEDPEAQQTYLRQIGVAINQGYEAALGSLSENEGVKEFIHADGDGGIERMVADQSAMSMEARLALDTTAKQEPLVRNAR